MSIERSLLRRTLAVWRRGFSSDGAGGRAASWSQVATVKAMVTQPTAKDRGIAGPTADQAGATITHVIYLEPDAPVHRGDELRGDGDVFHVHATVGPSTPVYLRADCEARQSEVVGG